MTNAYEAYYQEADAEAGIAQRNDVKGRPFWTPPTDKTKWVTSRIRICPPPPNKTPNKDGKVSFYTFCPLHGSLPGAQSPVLCPAKHLELPCPACAVSREYGRQGNDNLRIKFSPTWRALVNVIVLDAMGKLTSDSRPLWWGMPKRTNDDLQQKIEELIANGEDGRVTSPRYGRDVFVRRTGEGDRTRYEVGLAQTATPMTREMLDMLKGLNSLEIEECYELLDSNRIAALLTPPQANGGWDIPSPVDPFAPDSIDGVFTEIPEKATAPVDENPWDDEPPADEVADAPVAVADDNPFADDDASPFADDDDDGPPTAQPVTNAPARVAAARDALQKKLQNKAPAAVA